MGVVDQAIRAPTTRNTITDSAHGRTCFGMAADPFPSRGIRLRRGNAPPALLDGWGREVAVFPFPPRAVQQAAGRGPQDRYTGYYVKHIDCYGDEREEILVYDENRLYIYTNENQEARRQLLDRFPQANIIIRDATLEDVFLKLTGRGLKE